jgi:acyl-CoA synthetase (AMP-forming)/AMP-acid ligase II
MSLAIEKRAVHWPDRPAVTDDGRGTTLSYTQFAARDER